MKLLVIFFLMIYSQFTLSKSLYLEQLSSDASQSQGIKKELYERIKQFEERSYYTIKNLPSFHKQTPQDKQPKTLCQNCHGNLPHSKNDATRAFLNQHSQRIDCLTCHYQPEDYPLDYQWLEEDGLKTIVPFFANESLAIMAKDDFSKKVKEQWDEGDLYQKGRLHQRLHQPLNINKDKIECRDCHQKDGFLNLKKLNFDAEKIESIENNLISHFLHNLKTKSTDQQSPEDKPRILLRGLLQ